MFSFRSLVRSSSNTCPQQQVFTPRLTTPDPDNTIVVLGSGSQLVKDDSWSLEGIQALRRSVRSFTGKVTVFTCITQLAATLERLANRDYWGKESMVIGSVTIHESLTRQTRIVVNPDGPCDVVVTSTTYLDAVAQHYDCKCITPDTNCCDLALIRLLMEQFELTRNEATLILEHKPLPEHRHLIVEHYSLTAAMSNAPSTMVS